MHWTCSAGSGKATRRQPVLVLAFACFRLPGWLPPHLIASHVQDFNISSFVAGYLAAISSPPPSTHLVQPLKLPLNVSLNVCALSEGKRGK